MLPRFREIVQYWRTVLRSGVIGVFTGLLPGVGEDAGAWMSYAAAKAVSKEKEQFGKGSIDGLMAAETGDMASIPGHIIPCLALGIPGSAPSAVLMAAMIIHGIQPGPMLMIQHPHFVYEVVAMTTLASITILLFGLFGVRPLLHVLRVRRTVLMPIVFLLCTVGAFATASRLFDVYAMLAIGIGAFFLRRRGYEMAPLVLGLVLGPLLDKSLRRGLVLSDGSLAPFFTRPICIGVRRGDASSRSCCTCRRSRRRSSASRGGAGAAASGRCSRAAADGALAMKFALCNEVLQPLPFEQQCALAAALGYDGLEVAPFTLADDPMAISDAPGRASSAASPRTHGLAITGLHWLLVAPAGLSIVSADAAVRERTRRGHAAPGRAVRLMGGSYLVHGSPKQRSVPPGEHARRRARARARLPGARGRGARAALRRHLLHRAAVAARDRPHQHRRRGGGAGRRDRLAGAADDDRLQRRRPGRSRSRSTR